MRPPLCVCAHQPKCQRAQANGDVGARQQWSPRYQLSAALGCSSLIGRRTSWFGVGNRYYQLNIRDRAMDYYSEALTLDGTTQARSTDAHACCVTGVLLTRR